MTGPSPTTRANWSCSVDEVAEAFTNQVFVDTSTEKIEVVEGGLRLYGFFHDVNAVVQATPSPQENMWQCDVWLTADGTSDRESVHLFLAVMVATEPPVFSHRYSVEDMRQMADDDTYSGGLTDDLAPAELTLSFLWRVLERRRAEYNTAAIVNRASDLVFHHYYDGADPTSVSGRWHGYSVFVRYRMGEAILSIGPRMSEAFWDARMDFSGETVPWDDDDESREVLASLLGRQEKRLDVDELAAVFPALVRRLDMSVLLWIFTFNKIHPLIQAPPLVPLEGPSKNEASVGIMAHTRAEAEEFFRSGHGDVPFSCMTESMGENRPERMPPFVLTARTSDR